MDVDELVEMIVEMTDYQNNGNVRDKLMALITIKEMLNSNVDSIIKKINEEIENLATYNGHCCECGEELNYYETNDTETIEYAGCPIKQPVFTAQCSNCGIID